MTILPCETACLACLMAVAPPPGTTPTCDTAGIIGPIIGVIASIESAEALKLLSGHREAASRRLTIIDLWDNQVRAVDLARLREVIWYSRKSIPAASPLFAYFLEQLNFTVGDKRSY
jgi:adenylyltransferase/sulfurtransferase